MPDTITLAFSNNMTNSNSFSTQPNESPNSPSSHPILQRYGLTEAAHKAILTRELPERSPLSTPVLPELPLSPIPNPLFERADHDFFLNSRIELPLFPPQSLPDLMIPYPTPNSGRIQSSEQLPTTQDTKVNTTEHSIHGHLLKHLNPNNSPTQFPQQTPAVELNTDPTPTNTLPQQHHAEALRQEQSTALAHQQPSSVMLTHQQAHFQNTMSGDMTTQHLINAPHNSPIINIHDSPTFTAGSAYDIVPTVCNPVFPLSYLPCQGIPNTFNGPSHQQLANMHQQYSRPKLDNSHPRYTPGTSIGILTNAASKHLPEDYNAASVSQQLPQVQQAPQVQQLQQLPHVPHVPQVSQVLQVPYVPQTQQLAQMPQAPQVSQVPQRYPSPASTSVANIQDQTQNLGLRLQIHKSRSKSAGKPPVYCPLCSEPLRNEANVLRHLRGSHPAVPHPFPCEYKDCSASYEAAGARTTHFNKTHVPKERDNPTPSGVRRAHSDQKNHVCVFSGCAKTYHTTGNLNRHIDMQHLNKRFDCDYCEYQATSKANLKVHVGRMHPNQ